MMEETAVVPISTYNIVCNVYVLMKIQQQHQEVQPQQGPLLPLLPFLENATQDGLVMAIVMISITARTVPMMGVIVVETTQTLIIAQSANAWIPMVAQQQWRPAPGCRNGPF